MVFQSYALYPAPDGARQHRGFRCACVARRARNAVGASSRSAALVELDGLLERKPRRTFGRTAAAVALARALVREPALFLLDEPLSNLDARLRADVRRSIRALQRRLGVTTLHVTHDQTEAMTLGDRIVVLDRGRVQQIGTPIEVYERPANAFVAGFVGSPPMNLLDGDWDGATCASRARPSARRSRTRALCSARGAAA